MADLDLDAIEAALAPAAGHTEPGWDTEDAERWLRALVAEVRRLRTEVAKASVRRELSEIRDKRAERVEAALELLRDEHGHERDEHGNPWHPSWCVACVADAALADAPAPEREGEGDWTPTFEAADPAKLERLKAIWARRHTGEPDFDFREPEDAPAAGPSPEARELLADLEGRMDPDEYAELCRKHGASAPATEEVKP